MRMEQDLAPFIMRMCRPSGKLGSSRMATSVHHSRLLPGALTAGLSKTESTTNCLARSRTDSCIVFAATGGSGVTTPERSGRRRDTCNTTPSGETVATMSTISSTRYTRPVVRRSAQVHGDPKSSGCPIPRNASISSDGITASVLGDTYFGKIVRTSAATCRVVESVTRNPSTNTRGALCACATTSGAKAAWRITAPTSQAAALLCEAIGCGVIE